jgi:hypothetical protein
MNRMFGEFKVSRSLTIGSRACLSCASRQRARRDIVVDCYSTPAARDSGLVTMSVKRVVQVLEGVKTKSIQISPTRDLEFDILACPL